MLFKLDIDDSYWLNEFGQPSNYPESIGIHEQSQLFDLKNDFKAYNYPNPIFEGTKFRFFVKNENSAIIKIYDMLGLHIITLENGLPWVKNEFNEIEWLPDPHIRSGLYFAEVVLDSGQSSLVKVVLAR